MYEPSESNITLVEHASFYNRIKHFLKVEKNSSNSSIKMTFDNKKSFVSKDNNLPFIHEVKYDRSSGEWSDEIEKSKVMILWCQGAIDIRPYRKKDAEMTASNVPPFAIMDGLEFRVKTQGSSNAILLYKEI